MNRRSFIGRVLAAIGALMGLKPVPPQGTINSIWVGHSYGVHTPLRYMSPGGKIMVRTGSQRISSKPRRSPTHPELHWLWNVTWKEAKCLT